MNMKKLSFLIAILLLCAVSLFAQAPEKFTYQAVVRNASNSLVANAQVGVRVNILQGSASGNAVYSESHMATTNANGLITVNIGGGSVLHGTFASIDWSDGPYFLKTDIDPNGGNDYSITSVQQLLSVPYALYAKDAGNGFSGDYNDLVNVPQIPQIPADVSAFNNDAGYITGYTETDPQYNAWNKDYNDLINKPEIPVVPTNVSAFNNDAGYITMTQVPAQVNADWNATTGAALILNKPTLFSGNYNDLTNKPNLFDGNYNSLSNKPNLSAVAISGSYNDLINKPSIPTTVGELTNNVGYITLAQVPAQVNADWNAASGAAQILNKPTIPTVPTNVSAFTNDAGYITSAAIPAVPTNVSAFTNDVGYVTAADVQQAAGVPTNVSAFNNDMGYLTSYTETDPLFTSWGKNYNTLNNKPNLATVATSGNYNDLSNRPTIPTNVSAFTNDAGYITATQVPEQVNADWNATSGKAKILNKPTIPTVPSNVSAFTNDSHYITEAELNALLAAMNNTIDSLRDRIEELEGGSTPTPPVPEQTLGSVITTAMTFVGVNSAMGGGNVISDGNGDILARGLCWSTSNPPYVTDSHSDEGMELGAFTSSISNLNPGTTYYVRAYVTNSVGTAYGAVVNFTTNNSGPIEFPTVTTGNITDIQPYTATFHGSVVDNGGAVLQARGFVYGTNHNPTLADNNFTVDENVTVGAFSNTVTGLNATTIYYVRAYATNVRGTAYSDEEISFVSSPIPPVVSTDEVSAISYTSATCGGAVTFSGGAAVSARGLCYGLTEHPTINDNVVSCGSGVGSFTGNLTNLTANTVYHVRAFATNSMGTNYGEERVFSTLSYLPPTVEVLEPTNITYTSFTCGGNVTDAGSYPVTARGVCYANRPGPTINDNFISLGTGTGTFDTIITGLTPNTTYYVRAYANNQVGMAYSDEITVTTWANTTPTVTGSVSSFGYCIGNITSNGGLEITDRGFCYSTYPNPTILENSVSAGVGDGQFSVTLPNLVNGATYYVRAYATNALGINYGNEISFVFVVCGNSDTVTDYDGNNYSTVPIGAQCWMKENLRSTHYTDGSSILYSNYSSSSIPLEQRGYCYSWNAVMHGASPSDANPSGVQGICPTGWHLPSDAEWAELEDYVASQDTFKCDNNPAYIAKALASTTDWCSSGGTCAVGTNQSSNNSTGFGALPAGYYHNNAGFSGSSGFSFSGSDAFFWSSTQLSSRYAWIRHLTCASAIVNRYSYEKAHGFSVRCLRD